MTCWDIDPRILRPARLQPPLSKSDAQRAAVLARITGLSGLAPWSVEDASLPADVRVTLRGLAALAASGTAEIDCADGGTPLRLLLGQAAVTPGAHVRFTGTARLGERPHDALLEALANALGAAGLEIRRGAPWPIEVRGGARPAPEPRFRIRGAESSQFVSSLLLGAAALHLREGRPWRVELEGPLASEGYLALTLDWMQRCGFTLSRSADAITVRGWARPEALPRVPGDWSALGYLLPIAWRTGGVALDVDLQAAHPDRAIVGQLEHAGLSVSVNAAGVARVLGTAERGLVASGAECPDLLPTLAAVACVLPGESVLEEISILRGKESDRLQGIEQLVAAAGGRTARVGARLTIAPPARIPGTLAFDSRGDHRMAMSAATLAVLAGVPLKLTDPECVGKSFPGFWAELAKAGVGWMERSRG